MTALAWLMSSEIEDQGELNRAQMEFEALVANPSTNPKLIKELFKDKDEEDVQWITPQSEADLQELLTSWQTISEAEKSQPGAES